MSKLDDQIANSLVNLTEKLAGLGHDAARGFLGGEWGYGVNYSNDVFEMHPYWWGDCQCGYDWRAAKWEDQHPHADTCYQAELERRGGYDAAEQLAREWGLTRYGCAVHCTCEQEAVWSAWSAENDHDAECGVVRPNFLHKASGFEVRWYKYIGRSMELSDRITTARWRAIFREVDESLSGAA